MTGCSNVPVELRAGALRLAVRPDLGGSIAGLWHGDTPVMRSMEPAALTGARQSASYPLVPYSNRLGHRRFHWKARDYTTESNFDGNPHSVHGVAWQRPWALVSAGETDLRLRYRHAPDAHWPFAFEVDQVFSLSPQALEVGLVFTALGDIAQPVGLGWHPYFPRRTQSRVHMQVTHRWDPDALELPVQRVAQATIDGEVAQLDHDHCFEGWHGPAFIGDEVFSLQLTSSLP
ncbi:MAG: hypothetical protein RLZZ618_3237, partial [Pseudomonadota bacterium]